MKIAIIGLGNIGSRVAKNLTAGGQSVIVSERNLDKAKKFAAEIGGRAQAMSVDDAAKAADVIILAIHFEAIKEFIGTHRQAIAGKIIVDPSNPIAPDGKGGFKKNIPADQTAGQIIARLLPEGTELVKAFGTLTAESLSSGANRSPERAVLFYATDYPEAGRAVAKLIAASGFEPVGVGGLDQSGRIEAFGDLHQFGKLGRLISVKEAESVV
jgi:predicted dinucleotide-binding enzyme